MSATTEMTPEERYLAAGAVHGAIGDVIAMLRHTLGDDESEALARGLRAMLDPDNPEKTIAESHRGFDELFPTDDEVESRGDVLDRRIVLEARLLLTLAGNADVLIDEANRLLGLAEDHRAAA